MCDYSLHGIRNRLAEDGETLVVHRFYTGSKGLSSPEYLEPIEKSKSLRAIIKTMFGSPLRECAVCIPDGAKVLLHGISPALQQARGLCTTEPATFRQMSADASTYRDALEFRNGARVRLQDLEEGQSVRVLALSPRQSGTPDTALISLAKFVTGR